MLKKILHPLFLALIFSLKLQSAYAAEQADNLAADIHRLQLDWAKANYELKDEEQSKAFEHLIEQAKAATEKYADKAESWIWSGIIQSTYAGKAGPLSALGYAKAAKADLEKALSINPDALQGSAYTSLGTLYFKVPGWPLGFGDDDKAEEMLKKAVAINPNGIDSNYFYADFLIEQDEYLQAKKYLLKAQSAAPRPQRPLADKGRQIEIAHLLEKVNEELAYDQSSDDDLN